MAKSLLHARLPLRWPVSEPAPFTPGTDGFRAFRAAVRGALGDLATRLSGVAIVPVMLGAIAMVHWGQWSFVASESHPMGGMEFQVVLLLMGVYFALRGNDA